MLSSEVILSWIAAIVAVVGAVTAIVRAFKTSPGEKVDVAQKYQEIAAKAAEDAEYANARCESLETEVRAQRSRIEELTRILEEYQHGVILLIHQLEANSIQPVWKPKIVLEKGK